MERTIRMCSRVIISEMAQPQRAQRRGFCFGKLKARNFGYARVCNLQTHIRKKQAYETDIIGLRDRANRL